MALSQGARGVLRNRRVKAWPKGDIIFGFTVGATKHSNIVGEITAAFQATRQLNTNWKPANSQEAKVVFCACSLSTCLSTSNDRTPTPKNLRMPSYYPNRAVR